MKPYVACGHVFEESLAEINPRKVAEVVRRLSHKKQRLCDPFFSRCPKLIARFRSKRARLSLSLKSTPPAKFHPNPSKFPRFISKNDVPDRYNVGSPIKTGQPIESLNMIVHKDLSNVF